MENPKLVGFEIHNPNFKGDFCNPNFKQGVIPGSKIFPCHPIIQSGALALELTELMEYCSTSFSKSGYLIDLCTIPVDVE